MLDDPSTFFTSVRLALSRSMLLQDSLPGWTRADKDQLSAAGVAQTLASVPRESKTDCVATIMDSTCVRKLRRFQDWRRVTSEFETKALAFVLKRGRTGPLGGAISSHSRTCCGGGLATELANGAVVVLVLGGPSSEAPATESDSDISSLPEQDFVVAADMGDKQYFFIMQSKFNPFVAGLKLAGTETLVRFRSGRDAVSRVRKVFFSKMMMLPCSSRTLLVMPWEPRNAIAVGCVER